MNPYPQTLARLAARPRTWLVTGVAGFIGSNLLERLLRVGQTVVGVDDFSTGYAHNLESVRHLVGERAWRRFRFIEGDVADRHVCREGCRGVDVVLHQAALGSVPRSIEDPLGTHRANVDGFLEILIASQQAGVARFVYASSSSTYGDDESVAKIEERTGRLLSPYAVTKLVNELYAAVVERTYGLPTVGLRYFNVFGRRQDAKSAYAAVIPTWVANLLEGRTCYIHGDGETTRDFCYVENVVQANLLAATATGEGVTGEVYNVAVGHRTSLNELFRYIRDELAGSDPRIGMVEAEYAPFRAGDIRHSQADISKAMGRLGYRPTHSARTGLREAVSWYVESHRARHTRRIDGPETEAALPVPA